MKIARCPSGAGNCAVATGRVVGLERVDPDGDGDAHYVLAGGRITAPGISVIDVEITMRPKHLPNQGDWVSASGPVYPGHLGQHQVQATEINYGR